MKEYNDGTGESNVLQNQFTAYLVTAVRRQKVQYLRVKTRNQKREIALDIQEEWKELSSEQEFTLNLPLLEQFENDKLRQSLVQLKEKDFLILTRKVLDERSFQEIAGEIGIGYKTVASIYYRLLQKIRNEIEGEAK